MITSEGKHELCVCVYSAVPSLSHGTWQSPPTHKKVKYGCYDTPISVLSLITHTICTFNYLGVIVIDCLVRGAHALGRNAWGGMPGNEGMEQPWGGMPGEEWTALAVYSRQHAVFN